MLPYRKNLFTSSLYGIFKDQLILKTKQVDRNIIVTISATMGKDKSFLIRINESLAHEEVPPDPTNARVRFSSFIGEAPEIPLQPKRDAKSSKSILKLRKIVKADEDASLPVFPDLPSAESTKSPLESSITRKVCCPCPVPLICSCHQKIQETSSQAQSPPTPARRSPTTKYPVSTLDDYKSWKKNMEERAKILRDPQMLKEEKAAYKRAHKAHLDVVYDDDLRILADECIKDPSKHFTEEEITEMIRQIKEHWEDISELDKFQVEKPNIVQYNRMMLAFGLPIVHHPGCPCTLANGKTPWLIKDKRSTGPA